MILAVALIAIARKVIILDIEKYQSLPLVGIAALILAAAVAFHVVKRRFQMSELFKKGPEQGGN